jgi:hypothetical protein
MARWHFVVGRPVQNATRLAFPYATPLLEKERNASVFTLTQNVQNPLFFHRPGSRAAFSANDHPVNPSEIDLFEVFKKGFDR